MGRQFKTARKMKGLTMVEAAAALGISQPTLSTWEAERKSPSVDALERMADLYGVSTDYLLGRTENTQTSSELEAITTEKLYIMNDKPVWSPEYGWMLVDGIKKQLIMSDSNRIDFSNAKDLFVSEPAFASAPTPKGEPLSRDEIRIRNEVWVEPISPDAQLREELRGWYQVKFRYVENEFGNRFYLDTYGAKWWGFEI